MVCSLYLRPEGRRPTARLLEKDTSGYEDFKSPLLTKKELNNTLFSIIFYYVSYGFFNSRLNTVDILQSFLDISDVFVEITKANALALENLSLPYLRKYFLVEFRNLDKVLTNLDVAVSNYRANVSETAGEDRSLVEFTKKNYLSLFFATWLTENSENN